MILARSGSSCSCHLAWMASISSLLAMDFERDVRHALVDETPLISFIVTLSSCHRARLEAPAPVSSLPSCAFGRIGQEIVGEPGGHQARAGEREGDAAGVNRDPAAAPLLGHIGGGAAAARGIEHQVAGVGGHQDAALDDAWCCLNHINFVDLLTCHCIIPIVCHWNRWKIIEVTHDTAEYLLRTTMRTACMRFCNPS